MSSYRLNISFSEEDLEVIYAANEKVVIVKHTAGNAASQVAWVTFSPLMYNTIDWVNDFAVYSSTTDVQNGATINMMSDKMAVTQIVYGFENGYFKNTTPTKEFGENTYAVTNNYASRKSLTFGLAQAVVVNDEAFPNKPINAILVPFGQSAQMTPIEKVDVYLMCDIATSTVVSKVISPMLTITYQGTETSHSVAYDGDAGKFFLK